MVGADAAETEDLDIQMLNVSCAFPQGTAELQRKGHPVFKNCIHPDGMMWWQSIQDVVDPDKPETWLFQNCLSWIGSPRAQDFPDRASCLAFWRKKAEDFADPWRTVSRDFPDDLAISVDRTTAWIPDKDWSKNSLTGHVTLAGDAAHTMPPHRAQGLNNALEDAAMLVDELEAVKAKRKHLGEAVASYEKEMKQRALLEVPISIQQAKMVHSWDTFMSAPLIKHGMDKYKEDVATKGQRVALATETTVQ